MPRGSEPSAGESPSVEPRGYNHPNRTLALTPAGPLSEAVAAKPPSSVSKARVS